MRRLLAAASLFAGVIVAGACNDDTTPENGSRECGACVLPMCATPTDCDCHCWAGDMLPRGDGVYQCTSAGCYVRFDAGTPADASSD